MFIERTPYDNCYDINEQSKSALEPSNRPRHGRKYSEYYNSNSPRARELREKYNSKPTSENTNGEPLLWTRPYYDLILKDKWGICKSKAEHEELLRRSRQRTN